MCASSTQDREQNDSADEDDGGDEKMAIGKNGFQHENPLSLPVPVNVFRHLLQCQ